MTSGKGWYDYLAARHVHNHPIKTRPKFDDRLGVTLNVIEMRHQGSESIRDRIRAAVAIEDIYYLKTFPVEARSSVLE